MRCASGVFHATYGRRAGTPKLAQIAPMENGDKWHIHSAHPIWTKHVHTSTDVPFGGVNNVSLKFRSQTAKTNFGLMHTTLKRERYKSKHVHNFNTLMLRRSRGNCYTG